MRAVNLLAGYPVRVIFLPAQSFIQQLTDAPSTMVFSIPRICIRIILFTGTNNQHPLDWIEQDFCLFAKAVMSIAEFPGTVLIERQIPGRNPNNGIVYSREHVSTDDLEGFHNLRTFSAGFFILSFSLQFILHFLFGGSQLTSNLCDAMIIHGTAHPLSCFGKVFFLKIGSQLPINQPHGDLGNPVIVIRFKAAPGTVQGNISGERA